MVLSAPPPPQPVGVDEWLEVYEDDEQGFDGFDTQYYEGGADGGEGGGGGGGAWTTSNYDVNYGNYDRYQQDYSEDEGEERMFVEDINPAYLIDGDQLMYQDQNDIVSPTINDYDYGESGAGFHSGYTFRDDAFAEDGFEQGRGEEIIQPYPSSRA
jgi:hypothetical protein